MRNTTPGWWLQAMGLVHGGMGAGLYREPLAEIARAGVVDTVPDRGDRATAFWFMSAGAGLFLAGRLLRSAEAADDRQAQRAAGRVLMTIGAAGSAAMPSSGFWGVLAVGVATHRRSRRP